jgi:Acyl-CoA dehydrogenases
MDLELSPREKELAQRAREFCDQVLIPLEEVTSEHGELPMERRAAVRQAVRDWGFAGINHAKEHGGLGLTMLEQIVIEEQLGRVTNGLWSCVWRPPVSLKFGTPAQQQEYLLPSCQGERRGCFAITEPNAGSDPRRVETTARLENGKLAPRRREMVRHLLQRLGFHDRACPCRRRCRSADPVPCGQAGGPEPGGGLIHLRSPKFMHDFAFDHAELRLENLRLAPEKMLGRIGQGLELTKDWFVEARLQIAAHTLGAPSAPPRSPMTTPPAASSSAGPSGISKPSNSCSPIWRSTSSPPNPCSTASPGRSTARPTAS